MQPEQIDKSDLLDILFADRNKQYGAYPLRRGYNNRLITALFITGAITSLALVGYYSAGQTTSDKPAMNVSTDVKLEKIPEPEEPPPPPPPPPPPQVAVRQYTTVVVVQDDDANDAPPAIDELEHARVGLINQQGVEDPEFPNPPPPDNRGIVEAPTHDDDAKIFTRVEIESSYPGGLSAWRRFLIKTLKFPDIALENGIQGTVVVNFVVDKDGNVSNIKAISGPEELRTEAVRVITKSGKWTPAIQNGRQVNSYKQQQVSFQLTAE
jgi:protein TonB